MTSLLRDRPASTPEMMAVFDDAATLAGALAFEAALARASAAEGLVPGAAADAITDACARAVFDPAELAEAAAHAGTLAIPLVARLRELAGPDAAAHVHAGSTSQDLADTVLMRQAKAGAALVAAEARGLSEAIARLARDHAATPVLGRTLLQPARPVTLGLRAAQWLLGLDAAARRFNRECAGALVLQLGGAAGSMAGLNAKVAERMAAELGLGVAAAPWHARREAVAGLATSLAILTGVVGKVARDISLMAQAEVGEAFEPRVAGRGGSSAMAHKRNPSGCQVALSAALRAPHLAATILAGLPQEQERGLGGWQAEAPVLAELFGLAHAALVAMRPVAEGLEVDAAAMRRNLLAADVGADTGEAEAIVRRALDEYGKDR